MRAANSQATAIATLVLVQGQEPPASMHPCDSRGKTRCGCHMHRPPRIGGRSGASLEQAAAGTPAGSRETPPTGQEAHLSRPRCCGRFTVADNFRVGNSSNTISRASSNPPPARPSMRCFHARAPCRPTVTRYLSRAPLACRATSGGEIRPCFHRGEPLVEPSPQGASPARTA